MRYLLDTNIMVFLLRGDAKIAQAIDRVGLEECAISEITKAELLVGYHKAGMKGRNPSPRLFELLDSLTVIPISPAIDLYARELARLQIEGTPVDDFDLLIASTAVTFGLTIVTDDTSHFARIRGCVQENWHTGL